MIYSLGRALAEGTLTVPSALRLMREVGAEGVDISNWHVTEYTDAEVRTMVHDAGLAVSCYIGGADLTGTDGVQRAVALDALRRVLDSAAAVGAPVALVTTGICAPGQDRAEGRRNVAAGLAQLLPHARALGVTLTIEDFGSLQSPYQTSDECQECCGLAGDELMMTYDTGNMVLGDQDSVAFLRDVAPRVVHAHAKDWELLPSGAAGLPSRAGKSYAATVVGQGVLDYPGICAALRTLGYGGYLAFEYEGPGDPVQALRQGMAYLLSVMSAPN